MQSAVPLLVSFAEWRKPGGGSSRVLVIGSDFDDKGLIPWGLTTGTLEDIKSPDAIAVDKSYLGELGIEGIGDSAQAGDGRVKVKALTEGVRSFTQSPFAYTTLNRARSFFPVQRDTATFLLVKLAPGADPEQVKS